MNEVVAIPRCGESSALGALRELSTLHGRSVAEANEYAKVAIEAGIGRLLGPAEMGRPPAEKGSPPGTFPKATRAKYRQLATVLDEHPDAYDGEVEQATADGEILSKARVLAVYKRLHNLSVLGMSESNWLDIGIGDWWIRGAREWGEGKEHAERAGLSYESCKKAGWVSSEFQLCRRRHELTYSHHAEVAALPAPEQDRILDLAEVERWSTRETREAARHAKGGNLSALQASDSNEWYTPGEFIEAARAGKGELAARTNSVDYWAAVFREQYGATDATSRLDSEETNNVFENDTTMRVAIVAANLAIDPRLLEELDPEDLASLERVTATYEAATDMLKTATDNTVDALLQEGSPHAPVGTLLGRLDDKVGDALIEKAASLMTGVSILTGQEYHAQRDALEALARDREAVKH